MINTFTVELKKTTSGSVEVRSTWNSSSNSNMESFEILILKHWEIVATSGVENMKLVEKDVKSVSSV